ncbi:unnamed protein product [Fraxinus pennsylvanica]|uniref:Uncharacterized protein n=1 Tax=Fraxinus pennsylvanica TaxID=56036 RepID=A0AAD2DJF0_9LAMI|nr:unnamed protein product [Fraxinus pennsylvanica]
MEIEIQTFIKVWFTAVTALFYCYYIASRLPGGATRLISLLPVFYLFTALPLQLSSFHLGAPTIFYLVWLGNFKLLLLSFEQGPLSSTPPLSLLHFVSIALLPIKTKNSVSNSKVNKPVVFALKVALLAI